MLFIWGMEPNHPTSTTQCVNPSPEEKQQQHKHDISGHLADIELKIDHLIERIHDSLFRFRKSGDNADDSEEE